MKDNIIFDMVCEILDSLQTEKGSSLFTPELLESVAEEIEKKVLEAGPVRLTQGLSVVGTDAVEGGTKNEVGLLLCPFCREYPREYTHAGRGWKDIFLSCCLTMSEHVIVDGEDVNTVDGAWLNLVKKWNTRGGRHF